MIKDSSKNLLPKDLFVVGTTASGKSAFSIEISKELNIPIVNCDSLQFYKDLKIGTAYPSEQDFKTAPHYLFGMASKGETLTAGQFVRAFVQLRKKNPDQNFLMTGGSGFYIRALETGMFPIESLDDEMKHNVSFLDGLTKEDRVLALKKIDPEYLKKVTENDDYRITRALEVFYSQNLKMSELKEQANPYRHPKIGLYLERDELLDRVSVRAKSMLQQGLVDEVKELLKTTDPHWKPLQSVGYKESLEFINGQITKVEMLDLIIKNTMNLAKRQMTWFRADKSISWFHSKNDFLKAKIWTMDYLKGSR